MKTEEAQRFLELPDVQEAIWRFAKGDEDPYVFLRWLAGRRKTHEAVQQILDDGWDRKEPTFEPR